MALAQQLNYDVRTEGNLALPMPTQAPSPRRAPKTAPKRRGLTGLTVVVACAWLGLLGIFMALVSMNSQVLKETQSLTAINRKLAQAEQQNQELKAALVKAQSVDTVSGWAQAHGMQRPKSVASLKADPTAVAVKPDPATTAPAPAQAAAPQGITAGVWDAIASYAAKLGLGLR